MTITLAVLLGFALDWLLGDPKKLPHPVCAVGKLISGTEKVRADAASGAHRARRLRRR